MAAVALAGLACGLLLRWAASRGFQTGGLLTTGLALLAGLLGATLTRGRGRLACLGFLASYAVIDWIRGVLVRWVPAVARLEGSYLDAMLRWWGSTPVYRAHVVPGQWVEYRPRPLYGLFVDAAWSLPVLLGAIGGGLVTWLVLARRSSPENRRNPR